MLFLLAALIPLTFSSMKHAAGDRLFYLGLGLLSAVGGGVYLFVLR